MARPAVTLQAGCLLALLACAVCVAAAADADAGKKQTAGAQQYDEHYDEGPPHHSREYDEYKGHDEGYDNYHHSDEHYFQKTQAKSVYLQETSRRENYITNTTTFTFRCAKDFLDAADSCLHPTHYGYGEYRENDADNFLADLTMTNNVVECIVGVLDGDCPPFVPASAGCYRVQANCTVTKQAEECGCPYASGFKFSSTGYAFLANATSCSPEYKPSYLAPIEDGLDGRRRSLQAATHGYHEHHNVTIYNGTAGIITTHIDFVQTYSGYQEIKGKLDFLVDFGPNPLERRSTFGARKAAKAKTAYSHYDEDSDDEGRSYHQEDTPYYGHEDRYYEGAHRSYGGYGGGDYNSHPKNLVKGGNLKITLLEKQYY